MNAYARCLRKSGVPNDAKINVLAELCQKEADGKFPYDLDCSIPPKFAIDKCSPSVEIHLRSISDVTGVNKLKPKKGLDFGESNIAVIYGPNGSGKSGYVRLLKHVCGSRTCVRGQLHNDVFSNNKEASPSAKISFDKEEYVMGNSWPEDRNSGGFETHTQFGSKGKCKVYEWPSNEGIDKEYSIDLHFVNIFDASFGRVFMGSENKVNYEPPILSLYSELINVCDRVRSVLDAKIAEQKSKMPNIPDYLSDSKEVDWVKKLCAQTTADEIKDFCSFSTENETELQDLQKRISETSPADKAKQFMKKKSYVDDLVKNFQTYLDQLSDENCKRIIAANKKSISKKFAAEAAAKDLFSGAKLKGVGSDVWQELWYAARKYSEELAYCGQKFPYVQGDSACVLCHQPLSEEAKQRFTSFDSYIKDETQRQATEAASEADQIIDALPDIPSLESLKPQIDAAGIENQDIIKALNDTAIILQDRKAKVPLLDSEDALGSLNQSPEWIEDVRKISQDYGNNANKYEKDAAEDNRAELLNKRKDFQVKKWLSEQKKAIQNEVNRLQEINRIEKAKKTTNTTTLSREKRECAKKFITSTFVQNFNDELKELGASRLKVKLIQSKVSKGEVLHTIQLDGATRNVDVNEILSEGEARIVSIASFLADVRGQNSRAPLIFDDPISSLDQYYEEAVVQRLCTIASERQVIIFTHRLPLLGLVEAYTKKADIESNIICIRSEYWGTGEPSSISPFLMKPVKTLKNLKNDRLSNAKNSLKEKGQEGYDPLAKELCHDFRIILERIIEDELLAGIIRRHSREVQTKNKIYHLAQISKEDCDLFDELMTKYSKYEHSQSLEAPVVLPEPDELEADFKGLISWQEDFKKRCNTKL